MHVHRTHAVVAKVGLDGRDGGTTIVARMLLDAGVEVIHTGLYRNPPRGS